MAIPLTDAQRDQIVDLYRGGAGPSYISKKLGVSASTIYRSLKRAGVKPSQKVIAPSAGALEAFKNGESVYSIARRLGVSRAVVDRWVRNAGLDHRGCSEAGLLRAAAMTPEERAAQAAAAHVATRGRKARPEESAKRAITVERQAREGVKLPSAGEALMLGWLSERGFDCTLQKAVWRYNVDIAIGEHFAVEVLGGGWHAVKQRRINEVRRLEYLLGCGWSVVYVWNTSAMPMNEWCADQIVTFYEVASAFPSERGQYWVVRGNGKISSFGSGEADERALVLPSHARK